MKHIPRKRFGQNFLTDHGIIDSIVAAIDPKPGQPLVAELGHCAERLEIAEVVAGAGASVGSLYHHFGGKAELYLALNKQVADETVQKLQQALDQMRREGVIDEINARYL